MKSIKTQWLMAILFSSLATAVFAQTWSTTTISTGRMRHTSVANGNKLIIAGGYLGASGISNKVDIFDASTNVWTSKTLSTGRVLVAGVAVADKIMLGCGQKSNGATVNDFEIFDINTGVWTTQKHGQARQQVRAAAVGTKAYFMGGRLTGNGGALSKIVDIYDVATDQWTNGKVMPFEMADGNMIAFGTKIMVQGNTGIWTYDTQLDTWILSKTLSVSTYQSAMVLTETEIWQIGGFSSSTYKSLNSIFIYNIADSNWTEKTLLQSRGALMAGYLNGRVVIVGGKMEDGFSANTALNSVEIFNTQTGLWETPAITSVPHCYLSEVQTAPIIGAKMYFPSGDKSGNVTVTNVIDIYTDTLVTTSTFLPPNLPVNGFQIFPNPIRADGFFLNLPENTLDQPLDLQFFDAAGRFVFSKKIESADGQIFISTEKALPAGAYFLKIYSENKVTTLPILR